MSHPLGFIPNPARLSYFIVLLLWTLFLFVGSQAINQPLITSVAPSGIISLQLAWTTEKVQSILNAWNTRASFFAAFGLGFDFLFMPSYTFSIALGTLLVTGRHKGWFAHIGFLAGWVIFIAWGSDILENIGLMAQLINRTAPGLVTSLIGVCATIKFTLILIGIIYCLVGWVLPKNPSRPT